MQNTGEFVNPTFQIVKEYVLNIGVAGLNGR